MNKRLTTITIIVLLLVLAGYLIVDRAGTGETGKRTPLSADTPEVIDQWIIEKVFEPGRGQLYAVVAPAGEIIFLAGESFIAAYDAGFNLLWEYKTEMPVTALSASGDLLYAASQGVILVFNAKGEKIDDWGPFENNSMITSLSANDSHVAYADAANKTIYILDKSGSLITLIGRSGEPFIIPSPYFDIALGSDNVLFAANTGKRRIEIRKRDGTLLDYFGEQGTSPEAFFGCCNPAHFALIPGGFVTAEKGKNRIKILDADGGFVEFVSSVNTFVPSLPLDVYSPDGKVIFAANPADSKVYVFRKK